MNSWIETLEEQGWVMLDNIAKGDFVDLSAFLGLPIPSRAGGPIIDTLRPKMPTEAHPKSLSARYGLGSFPFHTDGAYMRLPPRYVLMRLADGSETERPTVLCDFNQLTFTPTEQLLLSREVWLFSNGRVKFYGTVCDSVDGGPIVKYDIDCMKPAYQHPMDICALLNRATQEASKITVHWKKGRVLIFDNWRFLHARSSVEIDDRNTRCLERVWLLNQRREKSVLGL